MDEPRFYQRPWFYIFAWSVILGGIYLWQVRSQGGILANLSTILMDGFIFLLGLLVWLAFFAQFVLPVRAFRDRQKIFDRLLGSLFGGRGPAIFVENGCPRERPGEQDRKGPGVLWLDSASAAVTRTATSFKQTIGPGVHFTENGESLAGTLDLHTQAHKLGPREGEEPFAEKKDAPSQEEYEQIQKRRLEVSAWTRDGIEVVPNISVNFKIAARPVKTEGEPGSRFGYEAEAVRKAITGEGINPSQLGVPSRRRVPWNQLPALLAADLWREYLAKFTLGQLFEAEQSLPAEPPAPAGLIPSETQALYQPASIASGGVLAGMLHEVNTFLARLADRCEFSGKDVVRVRLELPKPAGAPPPAKGAAKVTALQVINHMLKARLTQAEVPVLDDSGRQGSGKLISPEYQLLQERGLEIKSVSVTGLRFAPAVEEQLVNRWNATWLDNAKADRERIDRQRSIIEKDERVEAAGAYAESLSKNLLRVNPGLKNPKGTLKTLLLRTRDELLQNDRSQRRAGMELEELEAIILWMERNGS